MRREGRDLFSSGSAETSPGSLARHISKENEARELTENPNRLTTPFDIQNYLEKTGRGELCRDIAQYDKLRVDEALLDDLARAAGGEPARVKRLRNLALTNLPKEWMPAPQIPIDQIKTLIQKKLTDINLEARSKVRASDDTETEDAAKLWIQLQKILNRRSTPGATDVDEAALRFLEEKVRDLHKMMTGEKTGGDKARLRHIHDLNKIRQAIYWRSLHPETRQKN